MSAPSSGPVTVRRTGGFAGLVASGSVDPSGADPRAAEVRELAARIDLSVVRGGLPQPDHFVYDVDLGGRHAVVPEQHLTDDLRRLVELVLEESAG